MKTSDITRRRMANSGLTGHLFEAPEETVRRHGAMQAQDYGPAKWSIGQRTTNVVDPDLDRALATGSIVRTHALRPTWHFVASDDIRWLLSLTGPRVHQHNGRRYQELGLDERTRGRSQEVIMSALEGGNRLTRDEIAHTLDAAKIDRSGQRLPYILLHCELEAAICSGGLDGKQQTYALLDERVPGNERFDRDEALAELTRRYLEGHGPATMKDLRWWSSLTIADIKKALHLLGPEVRSESIEDITFWSLTSNADRPPIVRGVHLLQAYDELIVGYTESRYFGDPRAAAARAAWKDRSLPNGVVLLDGRIAGYWRRISEKDAIRIDFLAYEDLKKGQQRALEEAATKLSRFMGRPVDLETTIL